MATILSPGEEAQLTQTIEMFEVIAESQPSDFQSLEILKEAYMKLGRDADAVGAAKRIAQAYVQAGQLSSAILEYETILQRCPGDSEVQAALASVESQAGKAQHETAFVHAAIPRLTLKPAADPVPRSNGQPPGAVEDGQRMLYKMFVESKLIGADDFETCWKASSGSQSELNEPFVHHLDRRELVPIERSLRLLSDKSRTGYLPLSTYDVDMDLARKFPRTTCRRWCVLPFDRMSKSIFVATANPFNQQALHELAEATACRLVYYLSPPTDLLKLIRRAYH